MLPRSRSSWGWTRSSPRGCGANRSSFTELQGTRLFVSETPAPTAAHLCRWAKCRRRQLPPAAITSRISISSSSSTTTTTTTMIVLPRTQCMGHSCYAGTRAGHRHPSRAFPAQDGVLRCFYHGWGFGSEGKCVSVPTMGTGKSSACATNFAVAERDGILWIWRGHLLTADASKLPRRAAARGFERGVHCTGCALLTCCVLCGDSRREYPTPSQSLTVDTTLDYDCEWTHVMESNLVRPTRRAQCATVLPSAAP